MKILMVIGQFYPTIGGAEQQCGLLSKTLRNNGHTVKIITVWQDRCFPAFEIVDGIFVERVWYPVFCLFKKRIGFGFLAPLFMFWRVYKSAPEYDVMHAHQALWPAFVASVAAQLRKKPLICKIGNSGERFDLLQLREKHIYGRFAKWFIKKYINIFVWTSQAVYDDLKAEKILEKKLIYIPNGVELADIGRPCLPAVPRGGKASADDPPSPPGRGEGEGDSPVRFIFTGTLTPKKNLLVLIKAIHQLPAIYRDKLKLTILGDGPDRSRLTQQIQTYKLNDIVLMRGSVRNVSDYLIKSDVFVLPSITEGLSNSALEAMAHGLPVILSNQGGNVDLVKRPLSPRERAGVRGDTGILINPADGSSLSSAIMYMIDHPSERRVMGEQSRGIVEQRYEIGKTTEKYEKLYQSLL